MSRRQNQRSSKGERSSSPLITFLPQSPLLCANRKSNPNPSQNSAPERRSGGGWRLIKTLFKSCSGSTTKPLERSDSMKGLFKSKPRTPADVVRQTRELLIFVDLNNNVSSTKRDEKVNFFTFFISVFSRK